MGGMEKGKGKGGQKREGREEWGRKGKGASWLCGIDAPGIGISNKKPKKFLAASQPTGGGYAVDRDRRGRQGGDERGPQERSCGGTARSLNTALSGL